MGQKQSMSAVLGLLAALALQVPQLALAQSANTSKGAQSEYDTLINAAVTEYRDGNWVEARSLFERAHELSPSARTFRGIGLAAFGGKDYVTALGALSAALSDERKALTEDQRKSVSDLLLRAETFVAKYTLKLTPSDAKVRVDSREPVIVDGAIVLNPGSHELVVTAEGYEPVMRKLDVTPRDDRELNMTLRSEGRPESEQVAANAEPVRWGVREKVAVSVAALGVASLGASVYFGLSAKSKADDADCKQGMCDTKSDQKLNDQALTYGNVSTATAVVGAAALGAAAVVYFVRRNKGEQKIAGRLNVVPVASASFAGAVFSGTL